MSAHDLCCTVRKCTQPEVGKAILNKRIEVLDRWQRWSEVMIMHVLQQIFQKYHLCEWIPVGHVVAKQMHHHDAISIGPIFETSDL